MKKIVFLLRSLDYGGAQRQVVTLTKALAQDGFDITVVCFYSDNPLEKEIEDAGIKLVFLEKKGRWDILSFLVTMLTEIKKLKPDVIHSYLGVPNIIATFLKPFFPSCQIVWGVRNSQMDLAQYDWLRRLSFQIEKWLSRFADLIIVNSHAALSDHIKEGFPPKKMVVIPNGIDTEKFKPDSKSRLKFREEWGIEDKTLLIGLVARLDPMKDHQNFLQAAASFTSQMQDVSFICVGTGSDDYQNRLHFLTNELGINHQVIWTGAYDNMPDVYNALDIATSASAYGEGFSNAIGEAMACGVPCVVTDVGDSAWIVGETGVIVPPNSSEALMNAWISCLNSDRKSMGMKARSRIIKQFSIKHLTEQTTKVLF